MKEKGLYIHYCYTILRGGIQQEYTAGNVGKAGNVCIMLVVCVMLVMLVNNYVCNASTAVQEDFLIYYMHY